MMEDTEAESAAHTPGARLVPFVSSVPTVAVPSAPPLRGAIPVMSVNGQAPDRSGDVVLSVATTPEMLAEKADRATTYTKTETDSAISSAIATVTDSAPAAFDTLKEIADWIGDSGSGAQAVINQVAGKADKSEMSVTPGTGANADKTTIQLKSGTSATVLTAHQSLAGYATATEMNAALALKANSADVTAALALKADASSLPYALVGMQLSAWMYSWPEGADGATFEAQYSDGAWIFSNPDNSPISVTAAEDAMSLTFTATDVNGISYTVTATRGCQLADRAINAVSLFAAAAATLTMPAVSVAGHARDLVVRLTVGAADLNITWDTADADGVAVDYETEDGEFPDLSEAGTYLVRLTETAEFAAGTGDAADVSAKFLIQCQPLQTAVAGGES